MECFLCARHCAKTCLWVESLSLTTTLCVRHHYHSQSSDEEAEAESHRAEHKLAEPGFKLRQSCSKVLIIPYASKRYLEGIPKLVVGLW